VTDPQNTRHFNLPNHSEQTYGNLRSLHLGILKSRKTLESLSFKSALLIPLVSRNAFHSTNLFMFSHRYVPTNSVAPLSPYKPTHNPQFRSDEGLILKMSGLHFQLS